MSSLITQIGLDGATDIALTTPLSGRLDWTDDRFASLFDIFDPGPTNHALQLDLVGQDWTLQTLRLSGEAPKSVTMTDLDAADGRRIEALYFEGASAVLELLSTRIDHIIGFGERYDLTLAPREMRTLMLFDADSRVTMPDGGRINLMQASGNNTVELLGDARILSLKLDQGTNLVTTGTGFVESFAAFNAQTTLQIGPGGVGQIFLAGAGGRQVLTTEGFIGSIWVGSGNATELTVAAATVEQVRLVDGDNRVAIAAGGLVQQLIADGDNTVELTEDARIFSLKLGGGTNRVVSQDGNIESYFAFEGRNTLEIGSGGIAQIALAGAGGRQSVSVEGFLGSLRASAGNSSEVTTGSGGAGAIALSDGDNAVTTGAGFVGSIQTGSGNDVISTGTGAVGSIRAGGGDNVITTRGAVGAIETGAGADVITAGAFVGTIRTLGGNSVVRLSDEGAEVVAMGGGDDLVVGGLADDLIRGGGGDDTLRGGGGGDTLMGGRGNDRLAGGPGDDLLFGGPGRDTLLGGAGDDTLDGGAGDDLLRGGRGDDLLLGGAGDDTLHGGAGNDTLTGGPGADVFVFARNGGRDVITDFTPAEGDRLQLADTLWVRELTPQQLVSRFAEVTAEGDTVFEFRRGDTLTLIGFRDIDALAELIDIA